MPHSPLFPSSSSFFVNSDLIFCTAGTFLSASASSSNGLRLLGGLDGFYILCFFSSSCGGDSTYLASFWSTVEAPVIPAFSSSFFVNSVSLPAAAPYPPVSPDRYIDSCALRPYVRVCALIKVV